MRSTAVNRVIREASRACWVLGAVVASTGSVLHAQTTRELSYGERPTIGSANPYGSPVTAAPTDRYLSLLYEPLYRWNFLEEMSESVLAAKATRKTPTGRAKSAFVIDLKPNVKWHDGTPFTASDVEFTYKFILQRGQNRNLRAAVMELIADVKALTKLQVLFEFKQDVADPALVLTQLIIPQSRFSLPTMDAVDANKSLTNYPVGTGPYRQVGEPKRDLAVVAYDQYHDTTAKIESVRSRQFADQSGMVTSLLTTGGDINMIVEVPDAELKKVESAKPRIKTDRLATFKVHAIALRQNPGSPLRNTALRRAIAMAINRAQIRDAFFANRGEVLPGPFTPLSPYWDPTLKPLPFDTAAAREELRKSGYDGRPLKLIYKSADQEASTLESNMARTVRRALSDIGIKVVETPNAPTKFNENVFNEKSVDWDMAVVRLEFNPVYDISDYFLSSNIKAGGYNYFRFSNPTVDRLLTEANGTDEPSLKRAKTQQAARILRDSVPAVFIVNEETVFAYTSDLIIPDGTTDSFYFFTYANQWYFRPRGGR